MCHFTRMCRLAIRFSHSLHAPILGVHLQRSCLILWLVPFPDSSHTFDWTLIFPIYFTFILRFICPRTILLRTFVTKHVVASAIKGGPQSRLKSKTWYQLPPVVIRCSLVSLRVLIVISLLIKTSSLSVCYFRVSSAFLKWTSWHWVFRVLPSACSPR